MHRAANSAGQADNLAAAAADGRNAVQRARDAGAVVLAEQADPTDHIVEIVLMNLVVAFHKGIALIAELGPLPQVKHDLDQVAAIIAALAKCALKMRRQDIYQQLHRSGMFTDFGQLDCSFLSIVCPAIPAGYSAMHDVAALLPNLQVAYHQRAEIAYYSGTITITGSSNKEPETHGRRTLWVWPASRRG